METMLVAVDYSGCGYEVVDQAAKIAAKLGHKVVLLNVLSLPAGVRPHDTVKTCDACAYQDDSTALSGLAADASAELGEMSKAFTNLGVHTDIELREGQPAPAILEAARAHEAVLIALGTHGRKGLQRLMLGSVAEQVIRSAECPVLTIRMTQGARGLTATQKAIHAEGHG